MHKLQITKVESTSELPPASKVKVWKVTPYFSQKKAEEAYAKEYGKYPIRAWRWENYFYFEKPQGDQNEQSLHSAAHENAS